MDSPNARRSLEGHTVPVTTLAWSPEDNVLASGGYDEDRPGDGIRLWDPISGKQLRTLGERDRVRALAWQPGGKILASSSAPETTVRLWDPTSGKVLRSLSGHTMPVTAIAWAPHGKTIAAAAEDGTVGFWDPSTGRLHGWAIVLGPQQSLALDADGHWRASGSTSSFVYVYQTDKGQETLHPEDFKPRAHSAGEVRLLGK